MIMEYFGKQSGVYIKEFYVICDVKQKNLNISDPLSYSLFRDGAVAVLWNNNRIVQ